MVNHKEAGTSTVIAVALLIGLILTSSMGIAFIYSNFPALTAIVHPLLRVSIIQPTYEKRLEVVLEHVGGDVVEISKTTVRLRGYDESGNEVLLDSDKDNAEIVGGDSQFLSVGGQVKVVFENKRLKVGTTVEVTVIYAGSHVIFNSSATLRESVTSLSILVLTLTDPDIEVIETVWRPRLGENEYPRILGHNISEILARITVALGNSSENVVLVDNEVMDLVDLMKRMDNSFHRLQPGVYDRIRIDIGDVRLVTDNGDILEPVMEETSLVLPIYLNLTDGKSHELRIDIDAPSSLRYDIDSGLVWRTRLRVAHRTFVDDGWKEMVAVGEENLVRVVDGEVVSESPRFPVDPPLDVRCSTHYALIGQSVEFSLESAENVVEVSWEFGDGQGSAELTPIHAFTEPGGYEVRATARYADGTVRRGRVALAVTHPAPAIQEDDVPPPLSPDLQADVNQFTGQPSVRVPLKVPPGRKVEPSLSLVYAGGQFNQMLGVGWSLEGLGYIERDTSRGVPGYDNSDKFLINLGGARELVSLGEPSYPAQGFTWTVTGVGQERVMEDETVYPEVPFDWSVHAQGVERGMYREEFPDVPFTWRVEEKAVETWQEKVCRVDPQQSFSWTVSALKPASNVILNGGFEEAAPNSRGQMYNVANWTPAQWDTRPINPANPYTSMYYWPYSLPYPPYEGNACGKLSHDVLGGGTNERGGGYFEQTISQDIVAGATAQFSYAYDVGASSYGGYYHDQDLLRSANITVKAILYKPDGSAITLHEGNWSTSRSGWSGWRYAATDVSACFDQSGTYKIRLQYEAVYTADGAPGIGAFFDAVVLQVQQLIKYSKSATINLLDGTKDLGGFDVSVAGGIYTLSCDNPNVKVYFSDTGTTTTTNPNAHVMAEPAEGVVTLETLTENVTSSYSGSATVNMLDNWKDLCSFSITLRPQHGGTLSSPSYSVSCDEPRVQVRFSDTLSNETSSASAHVQAKTDYYEFRWYPNDYTAIENDSSGCAAVSALSENDLGNVMPPLVPQHEGTIENVVYTASCDDPRVTLRFSDTGTNQTSNSNARLIASTNYSITVHVPENDTLVSSSCSGSGSVSATDGVKDLGGFNATPSPRYGGVVENAFYTVTCDNPNVEVYFSDTGAQVTTNPGAHVMAKTEYQESTPIAEYRSTNANNARVKFNGEYWELWEPSGTRYTFGSSSGSRMANADGTFRWLLSRVTDTHGNYMTVSYTQDEGYAYPATIEYTGHEGTGQPPWVSINFVYDTRPDPITSYRTGSAITMSKRLAKIEERVGGGLVRTYEFGYSLSPATQRSLLVSVTERAGTGEAMPPATFDYTRGAWYFNGPTTEENFRCEVVKNGDFSEGWSGWSVSSFGVNSSIEKNHLRFYALEQGGSKSGSGHNWGAEFSQSLGRLEAGMNAKLNYFWYIYQEIGGEGGSAGVDESVILVRPDGTQVTLDSKSYPGAETNRNEQHNISKDISSYITQSGEYRLIVRLANGWVWGDRKGGWCYIQVGFGFISVEAWRPGGFRVSCGRELLASDLNCDAKADLLTITSGGDWLARVNGQTSIWLNYMPSSSERLLFGDFNGDGRLDAGIYSVQDPIRVAFSTGESFNAPVIWSTGLGSSQGKLIAGDFNGDWKTDLLAVMDNGLKVSLSTGERFVAAGYWLAGVNPSGLEVLSADFNGDGLSDAALVDKGTGTWRVALSTGRGFTSPAVWISGLSPNSDVVAMDLNRDGLADAAVFDSGSLKFARSTGSGFTSPQVFVSGLDRLPALADFNADGLLDLSVFNQGTCVHMVMYATGEQADKLTSARNELGGEVSYAYVSSASFAGIKLPTVIPVVGAMTMNDRVGPPSNTTYTYGGGKFEADKGFVGFGESSAIISNTVTTTRFHLDEHRMGLAYETGVKDISGKLYSMKYITWDVVGQTSCKVPLMVREDAYTYDGDESYRVSAVLYGYDDYGNLTKVKELGDLAVNGDERTTLIEYTYNLERWIMLSSHMYVLDGQGRKVSETWYCYDGATAHISSPTKGDLTRQVRWLDSGENCVTAMGYDAYGNLLTATDARGNATKTEYDPVYHIFPVKVINALGYAQASTWDIKTGQLLSQTDYNGLATSYEYDAFGRLIKLMAPGDSPAAPTKSFIYDPSRSPAKTVVQTRCVHGSSHVSSTYVFFDGFGRAVQTRQQSENSGRQVVSSKSFNFLGKVENEWLPYLDAQSDSYTAPDRDGSKVRYEYDVMGRVTRMVYPGGACVTAAHSDWAITTVDANGNRMRKTYDAYGRLVKIEEFNGSDVYATAYSYDAMGNLIRIVDAKGNVTTMTYDSLGRRTSLSDPDMGEWLYWYDANGNMIAERDAKGEVVHYVYDPLNRLVKKDYPSGVDVEYEYDNPSVPYSAGRRTRVVDASGVTSSYYDELGREIKTVKQIDGTDYVVERIFDSAGRVICLRYPDGENLFYAYNSAGLIEAVVGSGVYVRRVDYDAQGRITFIEYGNGVRTDQTYDALRLLTVRTNDGAFQDLSYEYDAAGNITKLVDRLRGMEKRFEYDGLNRLTYASGPYGAQRYAYDELGNLIEKDGINYQYGQAGKKPHAVTAGSDGFAAVYDPNGNMIWRRDHNGETLYSYDFDDRLRRVERNSQVVAEFVYDGGGGRVKKITPESSRIYIGSLYEADNRGWTAKHIFLGMQRVATVEEGGVHFYHPDHLGSASLVTDEHGSLIQLIEYDPFGGIAVSSGSGDARYRFMGKESDDETGLVYFGARYYDPMLGRFTTPDPLVQSLEDPQLLNRYTSCRNNPLVFQEVQGNWFWAVVAIVCMAVTVASFVSPSFNAWMHATFGDAAGPIMTAAAVVAGYAIAGPVLGVKSAGTTFAEAVTAAEIPAMGAAAATAVLDTGEGRQFISWLANEVFDDAFGMGPKAAYVAASVIAHAGISFAFESVFAGIFAPKGSLKQGGEASQAEVEEFAAKNPGGTAGGRPYVEPDISKLGKRPGKWTRLVDKSGDVAGYHWEGPIWDIPIIRHIVKHHQFYVPGMSEGFVPASMTYGFFGVCQQIVPRGYSSSIVSLGLADVGVYVTTLVYGQYGGGLLARVYWARQAANE